MTKDGTDTQAERTPHGKPESAGLANTPQDTATGRVQAQDGPMERPGTEAEEEEAGKADAKRRTDF
ncbi:hypothetical protein U8607_14920 [Methylobacterium durans]|uniref:hypothetical protein n=1 Tax=Methylobacterium durans TaxID=2202825 RepID=UPI002B0039BF|nr:hypothetical protein [Methylobacterium durans]MEA1833375.1 hypothetical protein [Methylobacterium durans]